LRQSGQMMGGSLATESPTLDWGGRLIPSLSDHPAALVLWHIVFLDRLLDRGLLIRGVIDDADQFGRRPADVVDDPGVVALFARLLGHCDGHLSPLGYAEKGQSMAGGGVDHGSRPAGAWPHAPYVNIE
jgi:hypothetical protein